MTATNNQSKLTNRKDVRHRQLSELSVIYEGFAEDRHVHPPDLSPQGMFINTSTEYPQGAVLKLRFRLARTGVIVETRGEVRYCLRGVGVGVEFVGISVEAVRAIEEEMAVETEKS